MPQGSPISPLYSNIYLNLMDRVWQLRGYPQQLGATVHCYADDGILGCRGNAQQALPAFEAIAQRMELTWNREKTRITKLTDGVDFIGFHKYGTLKKMSVSRYWSTPNKALRDKEGNMRTLFQKLLKDSNEWNQTQKEAMIDLCLLGMYTDDLVSLAEQDFIEDESTHLKWESGISFSGYLQRTIPKIRSVKDDSQEVEDLLQNIGDRLGSDESKRRASNELQKLLASDGVVKLEEEFLSKVQRVMGT